MATAAMAAVELTAITALTKPNGVRLLLSIFEQKLSMVFQSAVMEQ